MSLDLIVVGLLQGLILALVAMGVMLPFRMLDFPDLTAEGAYPLGGAVSTVCLLAGVTPLVASLCGGLAAGVMGMGTAWVHLKLKVNTLLAGIILSTMVYSINLRIMGKPNVALFQNETIFSISDPLYNGVLLICILLLTTLPLYLFLNTEVGLKFRAVGANPAFARRQGISVATYTYLGLFLAGCLSGFAGSLMAQFQRYMDVGMGVGMVIHALAALMIGEALVGQRSLFQQMLAPLVGALIYQQIQGVALSCGLAPSDLKFFTGTLVILVIYLRHGRQELA